MTRTTVTLTHRILRRLSPGAAKHLIHAVLAALCLMAPALASALPADFFAASSKLAQGNWARIEVTETGMQFVSNQTLRNLGFTDPSRVNVYGFGGRMLSEKLDSSMPDDLPAVPCVRTAAGIVFFGHSSVSWSELKNSSTRTSTHTINPYSDHSYYFLSDKEAVAAVPSTDTREVAASDDLTVFTERLVHEQDLTPPYETGRLILGEDFRTQSTRTFGFQLPGNTGDATVTVSFGAKVTNGSSTLVFSANGKQLPSATADRISGVSNSETFIGLTTTTKTVTDPGDKLQFAVQYSNTGALFTAALDYIEVEYPRTLALSSNQLYFHLSPLRATTALISGTSGSTVVWDVTDPLAPVQLNTQQLEGKTRINVPAGYREYVAFNPEGVSRTPLPAGRVANQDIHGLPTPDMVIVAPDEWLQYARRIADLHTRLDGMQVSVVTPQQVYNEFSSGNPDVTAFRKMLKMFRTRPADGGQPATSYCLLLGRPTYDPKGVTAASKKSRYPRIPIWQSPSGYSVTSSYSTDDYIGMLDDNITNLNMSSAKIHVAVGRMPVKTAAEASAAVAKLEKYLLSPEPGSWRTHAMVIADDQDKGDHLNQAEGVVKAMKSNPAGAGLIYDKLYLDSYPLVMTATGARYPAARTRMLDRIDEGVAFVNYIGHANPREWGHEALLTWEDINGFKNKRLPFMYVATCEFMFWDADEVSGAEIMWLNPDAGVIGMICPSRKAFISLNGTINNNTAPFVTQSRTDGRTLRVGDFMIKGKNATPGDNNKLRYGLMGDPAMSLPFPTARIVPTHIGDMPLADTAQPPVIAARSRSILRGYLADPDGNPLTDWEGELELQLYDAEKVITTNGNGADGVAIDYNDRKTRLSVGKAKISGGTFEAELLVPSEIENNYSPALLSMYASSTDGREAAGHTDNLYVYGFNTDAPDDSEGPAIHSFYLNSPAFASGSSVNPSPIAYASVSDPSGINLSDAGIGHRLTMVIDGKEILPDVSVYYTPSSESVEGGTIRYHLPVLAPGDHTLDLTVWDNANNSSRASLEFSIRADWKPSVTSVTPQASPARQPVDITVGTNGMEDGSECLIQVLDLNGRVLWETLAENLTQDTQSIRTIWDLCDKGGHRVARGIYLLRATLTTPLGIESSKTTKMAVAAP